MAVERSPEVTAPPQSLLEFQQQRGLRMEMLLLYVRAVVILANAAMLFLLVDRETVAFELAAAIALTAALYAVGLLVFKPFLRWPLLQASLFTTVMDSFFITIFVLATGGMRSEFHLLFLLSAAAIALRFSRRESLIAAAAYSLCYVLIAFLSASGFQAEFYPLLTRIAYLWLIAYSVGSLAQEERNRTTEFAEIYRLNEENLRLREEAERLAITDSLTGLATRRYGLELLAHEVERSLRSKEPLCLLFCDLDDLKRINDRLGHPQGDQVLQAFAQLLRTTFRSSDILVRYGGDEFLVILPECNVRGLTRRALDLAQKAAATLTPPKLEDILHIGVSIGIARCPEDATQPEELIKRADLAMYFAKSESASRVASYSSILNGLATSDSPSLTPASEEETSLDAPPAP